MPIIKSARKRVKVAAKANLRNTHAKRAMREAIKAYSRAVASGKSADIAKAQAKVFSTIDQAVKKAIIHRNKAARTKARLSVLAKAAGHKPTKSAVKKTPAKPAAKKTVKKTPSKAKK